MTETKPALFERFYDYAYPRPWAWAWAWAWAWVILRFIVLPAWVASDIVRRHVPEYVAELRGLWAKIESDRKAYLASR